MGTSAALHAILLGILLVAAACPYWMHLPITPTVDCVVIAAQTGPASLVSDSEVDVVPAPTEAQVASFTPEEAERDPSPVFGERVAKSIEKATAEAQDKTPEEARAQLKQLAGQLGRVSSEKSVDEMAGKFRDWMGTGRRAERPADKPVAGDFDYTTAQLHDVRRSKGDEGAFLYYAVLVDAAGRRVESLMDEAEGESAYKTMQLVKANPLAEMVYRRIVMGFLDNIIKTAKQAEEATQLPPAAKPQAVQPATP